MLNKVLLLSVLYIMSNTQTKYLEISFQDQIDQNADINTIQPDNQHTVEITITINDNILKASLNDTQAAKDFASLLPLTLSLNDYMQTEKVSDLDEKLSTKGSPSGYDPEIGDITYYAPWGNLAIFYKDFGYAQGLVKLGEINGDMSLFESGRTLEATFELVK